MHKNESEVPTTLPDEQLLRRFIDGDVESFEQLFSRHYDRVYGILFRLVGTRQQAEDLAQEVFLRLYQRPPAQAVNVTGWLYRVATNTGYNALRADKRRRQREQASADDEAAGPSVETVFDGRAERSRVRAVLAKLPRRSAQLLLLRHTGSSYKELAEAVGIAPGSVGTLLSRAAEAFRTAYRNVERRTE